ncbi:MAG: HPr family phosphocarrier protein [Gammaproteobacteria bacterium]|nr:HPr family phosphocarrier protein [Gammaproteobacteria bacterium]MCP5423567.1 HPr family phosphocarrier protein [Gammaproteobacteria bacterium]
MNDIYRPSHDLDIIDEYGFRELVGQRAWRLLALANHMCDHVSIKAALKRPLLGSLLSQATQLEELLDAYGARNNRRWCRFRSLTAAVKLFANVSYKLLHIWYTVPDYRLLPIEQDFVRDTEKALAFSGEVLMEAAGRLLEEAKRLSVPIVETGYTIDRYAEFLPAGRLPHDRSTRRVKSAAETVTHLATAFLNLAADSELLHRVLRMRPTEYAELCYPDMVSEENLRHLKYRFHNLQSSYDTYVSETQVEHLDADLPVLRGHISVVFHLLEIATELIHYYERHVNTKTGDLSLRRRPLLSSDVLLQVLMGYAVTYASQYVTHGQRLCHAMLKRYAEVVRMEVPVPSYRGFHVRPATLIAKIVLHYGSEVRMELDADSYDAAAPMDLFRANEKINASKRRWLASEIAGLPLPQGKMSNRRIRAAIMEVILTLAEQGKLVIYQQPLQLSGTYNATEEGLLGQVTGEIARLMATGQIDINIDLTITFVGDKRVLADIRLLAQSGYGEDRFGNNIALPKELVYLRR